MTPQRSEIAFLDDYNVCFYTILNIDDSCIIDVFGIYRNADVVYLSEITV